MSDPLAPIEQPPRWWVYRGDGVPRDGAAVRIPGPPPWRTFHGEPVQPDAVASDGAETDRKLGRPSTGSARRADRHECDLVNAAIVLRRPLLVTGSPGSGKSSLAYRIARELRLGRVLRWAVTSHSTLRAGLYEYDAIGRAQAAAASRAGWPSTAAASGPQPTPPESDVGDFIRLGPLGTALLAYDRPRVLLIDELDKSDVDLPNDLLHIFEDGEFSIAELVRARRQHPEVMVYTDDPDAVATVRDGRVRCRAFPIVVITSNGEREFPPAFLRRCLCLDLPAPDADDLAAMIRAQLPHLATDQRDLIRDFLARAAREPLARDQLLNAVFLTTSGAYTNDEEGWQTLISAIWHSLSVE